MLKLIYSLFLSACTSFNFKNNNTANDPGVKPFPSNHPEAYWVLSKIDYELNGRNIQEFQVRQSTVVLAIKNKAMNWFFAKQKKTLCEKDQTLELGKSNFAVLNSLDACPERYIRFVSFQEESLDLLKIETFDQEILKYFDLDMGKTHKIDFLFVRKPIDYIKTIMHSGIQAAANSELFKKFEEIP